MTNAISIQNIGKSYLLTHQSTGVSNYRRLGDSLADAVRHFASLGDRNARRNEKEEFWALDDVSFDVPDGQRVGIIGRNGAGKSTLLKIISRITAPTRGRIEIAGRVASLLEVGTGFHPELTGRENIFLNGSVLGMSRADIRKRFDEIVAFAEVAQFLDTPVKRYSSGMYMRLAFAVASHLEPDVLIIDEVLAVGDAAFQKKCLGKMKEIGTGGRTVLFVSHNMGAITEFCDRAILMEKGRVRADGTPAEIIPIYAGIDPSVSGSGEYVFDDRGRVCHISKVVLGDAQGVPKSLFEINEEICLHIDYHCREYLSELQLTVTVSKDGVDVFHAFDNDQLDEIRPTEPGSHHISYTIPAMVLKDGSYSVRVTAGAPTQLIQDIEGQITFEVANHQVNAMKKSFRRDRTGMIISPGRWTTDDRELG